MLKAHWASWVLKCRLRRDALREPGGAAPRDGIKGMAENVSAFTGCTEIQGTGDPLRTDDFYETILAMASHDLRQPLQLIISAQELLARRLTASPEREHLERSERASAQLAEQLDQLVEALHLHQSTGKIRLEPVPLQPILERLAHQLDGAARRKGVFLRLLSTSAVVMSHAALLGSIWQSGAQRARSYVVRRARPRLLPPARSGLSRRSAGQR